MAQQNRLVGLDNLRVMMIILHCSMTYMDYRPAWWYVTDNDTYIGFTLLVVILDAFPMTVLFLLAGYFAYPSFQQHGRYAFIKNKLLRIAIPWLIGVLFITPFFSRETSIALGYSSVPIYHYFTSYFFTPLYQQAHY